MIVFLHKQDYLAGVHYVWLIHCWFVHMFGKGSLDPNNSRAHTKGKLLFGFHGNYRILRERPYLVSFSSVSSHVFKFGKCINEDKRTEMEIRIILCRLRSGEDGCLLATGFCGIWTNLYISRRYFSWLHTSKDIWHTQRRLSLITMNNLNRSSTLSWASSRIKSLWKVGFSTMVTAHCKALPHRDFSTQAR
jgi:hypothetical protein